jgi:transcriptional regulator with XRE-family HTH domain
MSDMVSSVELARRLRMHMGDQRMTRLRLSQLAGISRPTLTNKLDGHTQFTYPELLRVIDALGVSWLELLTA